MILTPHFLFGAAIATSISSHASALLLAVLSHYLLDAIPHWDYPLTKIREKQWRGAGANFLSLGLDALGGGVLFILFVPQKPSALLGGILALLPDVLTFFTILFPHNFLLRHHHKFHGTIIHWFRHKNIPPLFKVATTPFLILFVLLWLRELR